MQSAAEQSIISRRPKKQFRQSQILFEQKASETFATRVK